MMMRINVLLSLLLTNALVTLVSADEGKSSGDRAISFATDVAPILNTHCVGCHQPAKRGGDYLMTDFTALLAGGETGDQAIVPGKPDESYLIQLITPVDGSAEMPQDAEPLDASEIELVRRWIEQGATNDKVDTGPRYSPENPPEYTRLPLVTALDVSSDGRFLATSGFQEAILIDAQTHKPVRRFVGLSQRIESLAFSPDDQLLAVVGGTPGKFGEYQIWEVDSGQLLSSGRVGFDTLSGGRFSPDGKLLAVGGTDNTLRAFSVDTGEQVLYQGAHEDWLRDCVFTPDGKHIVSAARDMTVKLTETATERFVDNITSITPGALSGGVNALAMHPERNEVLVGGADGSAKAYRVFRETERRIGDDANLIRRFPAMTGRIFALAIAEQGDQFAAASTLDGQSQIDVYPYDFDGKLPENVKAVMAKRVSNRKPEDKKLVEEYVSKVPQRRSTIQLPTSVYALSFSADGKSIYAGGSDGLIRVIDATTGEQTGSFSPVELIDSSQGPGLQSLAKYALADGLTKPPTTGEADVDSIESLKVFPDTIELAGPHDYVQVVVQGKTLRGQTLDLTRQATFGSSTDACVVSASGIVRLSGQSSGSNSKQTQIEVSVAGQSASIPLSIHQATKKHVDFIQEVNPILSRLGCNSGTCHGAQKGKAGFKLSLRGYAPLDDIRALSDDLESRRLNTSKPESSLMLLKPLGEIPHEGGVLLTKDSSHYETLRRWISEGAQLNPDSAKVSRIELFPKDPVIEREGSWQQFRVVAHYPDGRSMDVTREAFLESGDSEICISHPSGLVEAVRRGEAPILARYEGAYAAATVTVMGDRKGFAWQEPEVSSRIDQLVAAKWKRMKILPSELCTDSEFLRRVYLDLTGLPPTSDQLRTFLVDQTQSKVKRQRVIDELVGSPEYVELWTNKWADLLQVNSKFLGSEGAKSFRGWINKQVSENRPYDEFVHDILTASGSNKDNPPASYYKILRDPDMIMENTTHLFLAVRFNCNKCHDHPFERWTQDQYYELASYFAQTKLKSDPQSRGKRLGGTAVEGAKPLYEIVSDSSEGEMTHQRTGAEVQPSFPYDVAYEASADATRREQLAAWMTSPDNPYFASSYVNRIWGYMTGTGLMTPLDDIRAGNPPTNPELLEYLTKEFVNSGFDTEHIVRLICSSRVYQLSVATNRWNDDDKINYSHAKARRLPAEVLYDSVHQVTGAVSKIPGVEPGTRAAALPDVAVSLPDGFLNNLGRPVRESACECERSDDLQLGPIMALVSGPTIGTAISDPESALPGLADGEIPLEQMVREIYLRVLSRKATDDEVAAVVSMAGRISEDHAKLTEQLQAKEAWWAERRGELESKRLADLQQVEKSIAERTAEIADARAQAEKDRQAAITTAQAKLTKYAESADKLAKDYLSKLPKSGNWFPLRATAAVASNKATLVPQEDRSIVASGAAGKGLYTLQFRTPLNKITGLRLEALPIDRKPGGGPGLASNGNFVVTELEVLASATGGKEKPKAVNIAKGQADFSQGGFAPEQVFDGQTSNQRGWAVSPRGGTVHWASFQFAEPIEFDSGAQLTIKLHQNHNAGDHRIGRFRISVTTDDVVELGSPEAFAALASVPSKSLDSETLKPVTQYLSVTDTEWTKLKTALANAKKPLPADQQLVELAERKKRLSVETQIDSGLAQLRADVQASKDQLANERLTLAQDLTWALINSPAFLFNH